MLIRMKFGWLVNDINEIMHPTIKNCIPINAHTVESVWMYIYIYIYICIQGYLHIID